MAIILSCIAFILLLILISLDHICDAISNLPKRLRDESIGITPVSRDEREWENNPKEKTWFGNDVECEVPDCENYKDGRCEVFNCACKDEIACNTKYRKFWKKE